MKSICVYLGAHMGDEDDFAKSAILLGKEIAARNYTLIYGGSKLGLMGLLATTVKAHGAQAIGITTKNLMGKEKTLANLDALHVVESMQERKQMMQTMADMFIVMPGGLGTLEEAFETWNAIKLGELKKCLGFLNINGYFDGLFSYIQGCESKGFILKKDSTLPFVEPCAQKLMATMIKSDETASLV